MCLECVENFAQFLNHLEGSMKLPSGKYLPENYLGILSPIKIPTINIAPRENPSFGNSSSNNCFGTNEKTEFL